MNCPIDISNVILKTDRLVLRPWKINDLDDFYDYAKVEGVGIWAGWNAHKNKEESLKILESFIKYKKTFAIQYNNKVIGSIGIEEYDESVIPEYNNLKAREIGFVLAKDYWGQGIMSEAVKEVIRYLFLEVNFDAIFCGYYLGNERSKRVQEKCGFKYIKTYKRQTRTGEIRESTINVLLKEEWLKQNGE